jgi:teichuronic acid biosynthesis glycosyltransferase TuaG
VFSNQNQPLVSIIMPMYNAEMYIEKTLQSVINQTYNNWELLITDDFSVDASVEKVETYLKNDERIHLLKNKFEKGPVGARNTSITMAKGKFIAFLDCDDSWLPNYLEERIVHMIQNNYLFTYSSYNKVLNGEIIEVVTPQESNVNYKQLLTKNSIGCLTAIYDCSKLGKNLMPKIAKRQDYALWLNILKKTDKAYLYPKSLANYNLRENSISSNKLKLVKYNWLVYFKTQNFGYIKSSWFLLIFLFRKFLKQ